MNKRITNKKLTKRKVNKFGDGAWKNNWKGDKLGGTLSSTVSGAADVATTAIDLAQSNPLTGQSRIDTYKAQTEALKNQNVNASSMSELNTLISNLDWSDPNDVSTNFTLEEAGGKSGGQIATGIIGAAAAGAAAGSMIAPPWGCVCAGTRVLTKDGVFKNIEDLKNEDGVLGFDGNKSVSETISLCEGEAYKECVEIIFESGNTLKCSTDHPLYLSRQHERLQKQENNKKYRIRKYDYIQAKDCNVGDSVGLIRELPYFGEHDEPYAYLIGLLIGDGTYGKGKGARLITGDKDTWDYIENNKLGYVCDNYNNTDKYSKEMRLYRIYNGSNILSNCGIYGQTKLNKTLPLNIQNWNKESLSLLIAGLIDSDGFVTVEKNNKKCLICFTQSNLPLLKRVQEILVKFGIHSAIKTIAPKQHNYKKHTINSKESYKLIIKDKISIINFYNNIKLNISYKQNNLNKCFEIANNRYCHDSSFRQGLKADRIISITPIGIQRIYNLEAHEHHNYIANFIVTHNTIGGALVGAIGAGIGVGVNQANARKQQELYALQAEAEKAKQEQADKELIAKLENTKTNIMQNDLNNYLINKVAYGGPLFNLSGDFNNGITFVDEGGTHEENPFEGVQVGVDNEGIPNLVEEGEIIFGDYVFSNRLKPTKKLLEDGGFSDRYEDWTFAKIVEDLQKESAERPNDLISNNGLNDMMGRMITMQEQVRQKKNKNKFSQGGKVNKFDEGTPSLTNGHLFETKEEEREALASLEEETKALNAWANVQANAISIEAKNKERAMFDAANYPGAYDDLFPAKTTSSNNSSKFNWSTLGRYAPAAINAISSIANAFEKPDKLDYKHHDTAFDYAKNIPVATYNPVGGKVTPDLINPNYLLNQHAAERAALRRAISENAVTGSQAMMHLANADYNAQRNDADALLQLNRENWSRKLQAAQHNLGIDTTNSQMGLQALGMNQTRAQQIANAAFQNANAKMGIDQFNLASEAQKAQALSQSMGALSEDLAGIASENYWRKTIMDNPVYAEYIAKGKLSVANGGMLTRKKRRK